MSSLPSSGLVQELGRGPFVPMNEQAGALQSRPTAQVDDESSCLRNNGKGHRQQSRLPHLYQELVQPPGILSLEPGTQVAMTLYLLLMLGDLSRAGDYWCSGTAWNRVGSSPKAEAD